MEFKRIFILGLLIGMPVSAAAQGVPAFRVPLERNATSGSIVPVYSWIAVNGNCSNSCGTGTRQTTYQCQDVTKFEAATGDFGNPEPIAECQASIGASPATTSSTCSNFAGCGFDWVKPPEIVTVLPVGTNPVGRPGCGMVKRSFEPSCKRADGTVLAKGDHAFCKNDLPDYVDVRDKREGALGYESTAIETGACNSSDNEWRAASWSAWTSDCSVNAIRTRQVQCVRKFDGSIQPDGACAGVMPGTSEVAQQYGSCTYTVEMETSKCVGNGVAERNYYCTRSDGLRVPISMCGLSGEAEQFADANCNKDGWEVGEWSAYGACTDSGYRQRTRSVVCKSGGAVAGDEVCKLNEAKPKTGEVEDCPQVACSPGLAWSWNDRNWDDYGVSPNWTPLGGMNGSGPRGTLMVTNAMRAGHDRTYVVVGITVEYRQRLIGSEATQHGIESCPR